MNINNKEKILERVQELTDAELDHLIQLSEIDIANYKVIIASYNEEKKQQYGLPFLSRLEAFDSGLMAELERRTG